MLGAVHPEASLEAVAHEVARRNRSVRGHRVGQHHVEECHVGLVVAAARHDGVVQAQHVHADRPELLAVGVHAHEGGDGCRVVGIACEAEPVLCEVAVAAVVDEHAQAAGRDHAACRAQHASSRVGRAALADETDVDAIAADTVPVPVLERASAGADEDVRKVPVRRQRRHADTITARQMKTALAEAVPQRQRLAQVLGAAPGAGDPHGDLGKVVRVWSVGFPHGREGTGQPRSAADRCENAGLDPGRPT